jgi:predicted dehydrogenase
MSIKIIQIGVGGFGNSWRHALKTTPDVEVVGLVDIDNDKLNDAKEFYGVSSDGCFTNPDKEWFDTEADIVLDATPQINHYANAMKAFVGGKHLIVVKPMSDSWETGLEMVREAKRRNLKMVVAQQLRFHPVIMKIREIIQSGILGKIGYIHQDAFFSKKGYSGSYPQPYPLLVQGAIHFFDYIRWVLGQDAINVWAECWNTHWIETEGMKFSYAVFEMSEGCRVCFRGIASSTDTTNWTCNWRIEGDKGILSVINDILYLNGEKIPVKWWDETDISDLNLPVLNKIILEKMIDYINAGEEPGFSGKNNLGSMEMAFKAIKSSVIGQKCRLGVDRV